MKASTIKFPATKTRNLEINELFKHVLLAQGGENEGGEEGTGLCGEEGDFAERVKGLKDLTEAHAGHTVSMIADITRFFHTIYKKNPGIFGSVREDFFCKETSETFVGELKALIELMGMEEEEEDRDTISEALQRLEESLEDETPSSDEVKELAFLLTRFIEEQE